MTTTVVLSTRTQTHHGVRQEAPLRMCRNCVRWPRKHPQTPTFTGSHQEAFCGGKSLNRLREEMFSVLLDAARRNRFPSGRHRPLGHLSL